MPPAAALDSARALVGWQKLSLDSARRAVRLATAGMRLDLGGIAKGYILQAAVETLRERGVARTLIEAGGDIVAGDPPAGRRRRGWRVEAAGADPAVAQRAARLARAAIATSGPTEQFVEIGGTRYSHVVDPRTGVGLTNGLVATVIAPDGATADALATALTVLDAGRRAEVLARFPGVQASVRPAPRPRR
ncbi:MAG TPA: FAD:protein FMN transferase [Gemmatimonadaceae bacterium]|nr:FAD:protein FMN transferase [Gemmatimonadaceae bacterium]